MKTKFLMLLAVLLTQIAVGQKMDPKEMAEYQNEIMFKRLDLSVEQQEQITTHNIRFSEKQAALMNREGSMFGKMGEIRKLKKERNAELENILSREQMEIFEDDIEPEIRTYMRSKILLGIAIILSGVFVFVLIGNTGNEVEEIKKTDPPMVSTSLVKPVSIPYTLEVTGTLEAKNKVDVYSEVQGVLLSNGTPFKEGNTFRKGEYLLQVDDREYRAQLLSNKSSLVSQITAMLPDMEIEFPNASKKWESYLKTFIMDGPLTPLPKTATDKEKFFVTGKGIIQTYYNVKNQQERLSKYKIGAPFNGTVTESNVNAGTLVRSGQKLGEFVDTSVFELQLSIPATANRYIKVGRVVRLSTLDNYEEFFGKISRINAKVDQATQTISAIVEVSKYELKDGQFLKAKIEGNPIEDVVKIKGNLLLENDQIYIVRDSVLTLQKVIPINYEEDSVLVKGLKNNMILLDEVLASAYPGMKVNF